MPFTLRERFDDRHPLFAAWRFIEPLLFGQLYTNKQAIASHYNADPKLFLSFFDPIFPAYSQDHIRARRRTSRQGARAEIRLGDREMRA